MLFSDPKQFFGKVFRFAWTKKRSHIESWKTHLGLYRDWFDGKIPVLYGAPSPTADQKPTGCIDRYKPLLAWFDLHQKPKYALDLGLEKNVFHGLKVLDVGSGPFPSASVFEGCELFCLDPIMDEYLKMGFPLHVYESRIRFVQAPAEDIPFSDGFFDAVISVNAIDHVGNFAAAAKEIRRVLKPGGKFAMHVHYHPKTKNEPLELNDEIFLENFSWCGGLRKMKISNEKFGWKAPAGESYVIWRNF